jgi:Fibrobacter succinogenes major domain (Fib_succ_major).
LKILFFALFFATVFIFSCADYPRIGEIENTFKPEAELKDSRDGQSYPTVRIGSQIWMAKNLDYDTIGSKCYNDKPKNCDDYGRLYNWATAMNFDFGYAQTYRGICPSGWHLPSDAEWRALVEYVGINVGVKLRAKNGWIDKADNGDDDYGFSAKPSGFHNGKSGDDAKFGDMEYDKQIGYWWSSTEFKDDTKQAYYRDDNISYDPLHPLHAEKIYMFAVRCIKD